MENGAFPVNIIILWMVKYTVNVKQKKKNCRLFPGQQNSPIIFQFAESVVFTFFFLNCDFSDS